MVYVGRINYVEPETSPGLSIQSISVDCADAVAEIRWSFDPREGCSPRELTLSNLLHHRSAVRSRCSTLEDITNRRFEPLVRYSDSAAILVVDPSGEQWVGSWSSFFVFCSGCHIGSLLSSNHLSPCAPLGSRFAEKFVDRFHLETVSEGSHKKPITIMNVPSPPHCASRSGSCVDVPFPVVAWHVPRRTRASFSGLHLTVQVVRRSPLRKRPAVCG